MTPSQTYQPHQPQPQQHAISSRQHQLHQVLDKIMPQIQRQLIHDIQQQLDTQFQQTFLKRVHEMDTQALAQYQQALMELEQSKTMLEEEKERQLRQEIESLQGMLQGMRTQHLMRLQQEWLQRSFDNVIMSHPQILALQKQLQEQIFLLLQPKHQSTKSRQIKQLIITHQTKQIKLRKQLDQQIKSKIYYSSGLEQLKHEIKQSKTQMGSQKSEYNLRLKRIQGQIKEYQEKIMAIQGMGEVEGLEDEYQQLKIELLQGEGGGDNYGGERQKTGNKQATSSRRTGNHNNNHHNAASEDQQQQQQVDNDVDVDELAVLENEQRQDNEQQQYESNHNNYYYSPQSDSYHYNNNVHTSKSKNKLNNNNTGSHKSKFDLTAYFNHYLEKNQQKYQGNQQQLSTTIDQQQNKSLLNLKNISQILKQKFTQEDPLEKYIQSQQKENNPRNNNNNNNTTPSESNFTQLYQQHLKNLNKGFAKKAAALNNSKNSKNKQVGGLSQMAKKTIIRNLAQYHKSNFSNTANNMIKHSHQQPESKRISTFEEQTPEGHNNAYETNLLAVVGM